MTRRLDIELTDELIERMVIERSSSRPDMDLVDGIMAGVALTRQRRRHLVPVLHERAPWAPARFLVAALLALLVLGAAVVVGSYLLRPRPTPLPAALHSSWASSGQRTQPYRNGSHVVDARGRVDIVIGDADIRWQGFTEVEVSSLALVAQDALELRLRADPQDWHCRLDDVGTYKFSLSSTDRSLILTPVQDVCAVRAGVLAGTWLRTDIGSLAQGKHVAPLFHPFGGGTTGRLSYVTPSGWAEPVECEACVTLSGPDPNPPTITLLSNAKTSTGDAGCATPAEVGTAPDEIAGWLRTLPGLVVTKPIAVTIGGHAGLSMDLGLAPGWVGECGNPSVLTFMTPTDAADSSVYISGEHRDRYILLDGGDGQTLLIDIQVPAATSWDAAMAAVMPIIESFGFAP